jgi:hypothetical protein
MNLCMCKRHFLDYVAESNCSTSISVGDTYTIVADYEFSRCQECASDAGELIYSDEWEQARRPLVKSIQPTGTTRK